MKQIAFMSLPFFLICIFIISVLLYSCNTSDPVEEINTPSDTLEKDLREPKLFEITFDHTYKPDLKSTPWQGTLVTSECWNDKLGQNLIVISELPQYFWKEIKPGMKKYLRDGEDSEVAELFAYHYIFDSTKNKWKIYWALNDFRFSSCDVIMHYLPGTLKITDLDMNGKTESVFTYYSALCTQPLDLNYNGKLMFHVDSFKYSIKGNIGLYRDREDIKKPNEYSQNFSGLGAMHKNYADQMWLTAIAIRDSLDKELAKEWAR